MNTLIIKNLSKLYKKRSVVNTISLNITSGEIVGLLGPNGSGKTTIFYMILGIIRNNAGDILLNNKNISTLPTYIRARLGIGYLPQENSIFRRLTVFNNLMAVVEARKNFPKKKRIEYVFNLMHNFQILHLQNNIGQTLSGGERKRVELARTLATNPKFILLDEPFSGVDPIAITHIQKIIKQLQSHGLGILITDHNVRETLRICNKAYIINQGVLIAKGSPKDILNNHHAQKVYLGTNFVNYNK